MLDAQVERQAEQNRELAAIAAKQSADFQTMMAGLSQSFQLNQNLLSEYGNENEKLKQTRKQIKIDSYLAMSNSFSTWDQQAGLSIEEFRAYLDLLGPEFEDAMLKKYGGNVDTVFKSLDIDNNGSLNIPEVRKLLRDLVTDETIDSF